MVKKLYYPKIRKWPNSCPFKIIKNSNSRYSSNLSKNENESSIYEQEQFLAEENSIKRGEAYSDDAICYDSEVLVDSEQWKFNNNQKNKQSGFVPSKDDIPKKIRSIVNSPKSEFGSSKFHDKISSELSRRFRETRNILKTNWTKRINLRRNSCGIVQTRQKLRNSSKLLQSPNLSPS